MPLDTVSTNAEYVGAALNPPPHLSHQKTLFERLGGTEVVRCVVNDFYDRCLKDDELSGFFEASRVAALRQHQLQFLKVAFTHIPDELDVAKMLLEKHRLLFQDGLNAKHFDLVCKHLVASLHDVGVSLQLIDEAAGILTPLRPIFEEGARLYGSSEEKKEADSPHVLQAYYTMEGQSNMRRMTLIDRLGGNDVLKAAVHELYSRLLEDVDLAPFFQEVNMTKLKIHQLEFLKVAFTQIPTEMNLSEIMVDKHASLFKNGLNETHFDKMQGHLAATLEELNIPLEVIEEAVAVIAPLRLAFEAGAMQASERK